jgi:hypothetical protein
MLFSDFLFTTSAPSGVLVSVNTNRGGGRMSSSRSVLLLEHMQWAKKLAGAHQCQHIISSSTPNPKWTQTLFHQEQVLTFESTKSTEYGTILQDGSANRVCINLIIWILEQFGGGALLCVRESWRRWRHRQQRLARASPLEVHERKWREN